MEKERFSLLLLDSGEFYFEDFSIYVGQDEVSALSTIDRCHARLKLCSKSLLFDIKDISEPIMKIPFKDCSRIFKRTFKDVDMLVIECSLYVEILAGNVLAPYTFKNGNFKFFARFNYALVDDVLPHICQLQRASSLPIAEQNQMIAAIAHGRHSRLKFDLSWLEDLDEKIILDTVGNKITPLIVNPGRVVLTSLNLYFQPFNNIEPERYVKIKLAHLKNITRRRFLLQHVGLELHCDENSPINRIYLSLKTAGARDTLYNCLMDQPALKLRQPDQDFMMLQWQHGIISNYDYLLYINSLADRTFDDLTQYPVFPWIISDYTSPTLDLANENSYRDLTKPIGALNPERLKRLKERYNEMSLPKFLYGSHYSTPGFVLFYLVRKYPHYMLCLQNGRFDHPDRMFNSISDIWKNVLTNMSDFKELVPEFYDVDKGGDFLQNTFGVNFGYRHDGSKVGDVQLPPWATDAADFVKKLRNALESDHVSRHLHNWLDLIFGYKQMGEEAVKSDNKFYYLCYEGAVDLDSIKDWNQRHALEIQIMEFGQIPKRVFTKPHPGRNLVLNLGKNVECLDEKRGWTWRGGNLNRRVECPSHKGGVLDVAVSLKTDSIFSVGKDAFLKIYDARTGAQERSVSLANMALSCIVLLEDDATVVIGCWDSSIIVYDVECGRVIDILKGHEDAVSCLGWCDEKQHLVSGSWDGTMRVWKSQLPWMAPLKPTSALLAQLQHEAKLSCLCISNEEHTLVTGTEEGDIFVWSMQTYKVTSQLAGHNGKVAGIRLSPSGERLISCGSDRTFRIYDLVTGTEIFTKTLDQELNCLQWDGFRALIGGNGGVLYGWDLIKNVLVTRVKAHEGRINAIAISEDASLIATGGNDCRIICWTY